jgi:hypothetical protein
MHTGPVKRVITGTLCLALAALLYAVIWHMWGVLYGIGVHPYPGPQTPWTYQLLSGFVPALTVVGLISLVTGAWHHVNCHEPGCLRIGKHKVNGTPWCNVHHEKARPERTENELLELILAELAAVREARG